MQFASKFSRLGLEKAENDGRLFHVMNVKYLGKTLDVRTNTSVIYAQMTTADYLDIIGEKFDEFKIQRRREKHRGYQRMRDDIIAGTQLPSITLALKPELVDEAIGFLSSGGTAKIEAFLAKPDQVNILDGLQRTYLLHDLKQEGISFKPQQMVLVEFWLEKSIKKLIYRIIILNAGQKPMSMRHQVELLFETIKTTIQIKIPTLKIFVERDEDARKQAAQYQLDRLVMAFQSFLTKTPEVSRESLIAQKLIEEGVLDLNEDQIGEIYESFLTYLKIYTDLDRELCRVYDKTNRDLPTGIAWFGSENVMNSFFAALSEFGSTEERKGRIRKALTSLENLLHQAKPGEDPFGLGELQSITRDINPRKTNVGFATRKLLASAFKEFFRDEGNLSLASLWAKEAD